MDPDPAIFVVDLQEANKKLIFLTKFSVYYLFKGTFTSFSKKKSQIEVTEQEESRFFLLFLLDDRRIQIRSRIRSRIRNRIHTSD
jgi:hypothetical protein